VRVDERRPALSRRPERRVNRRDAHGDLIAPPRPAIRRGRLYQEKPGKKLPIFVKHENYADTRTLYSGLKGKLGRGNWCQFLFRGEIGVSSYSAGKLDSVLNGTSLCHNPIRGSDMENGGLARDMLGFVHDPGPVDEEAAVAPDYPIPRPSSPRFAPRRPRAALPRAARPGLGPRRPDPRHVRWRRCAFTPYVTLWTFLGQALCPDHSCRAAVARLIALLVSHGEAPCSAETDGEKV